MKNTVNMNKGIFEGCGKAVRYYLMGNWAFGRASAAAGLPIGGVRAIAGALQILDHGVNFGYIGTIYDNPRDYGFITHGFNSSPHLGIIDGGGYW